MKISEGFVLRKVGKEQVVVALGEASALLNGLIKLNGSGVVLWKQLELSGASWPTRCRKNTAFPANRPKRTRTRS